MGPWDGYLEQQVQEVKKEKSEVALKDAIYGIIFQNTYAGHLGKVAGKTMDQHGIVFNLDQLLNYKTGNKFTATIKGKEETLFGIMTITENVAFCNVTIKGGQQEKHPLNGQVFMFGVGKGDYAGMIPFVLCHASKRNEYSKLVFNAVGFVRGEAEDWSKEIAFLHIAWKKFDFVLYLLLGT